MRKPTQIERLYLDFDGFFASVAQQVKPELRGRPVGIVPFSGGKASCVIACSKEAKALGLSNVMPVGEAKRVCPDLVLVPQQPHLYRRAHNALLAEIESVVPIDAIKSIDELTCKVDPGQRRKPQDLARAIKQTIGENIGQYITCSIGFAANRQLAKIACKMDKPDGVTIWHPDDMPGPLLAVPLKDIPGVGTNMAKRLMRSRIYSTQDLYETAPKQMRKIWRNVTGERLWYALHGYDIQAPESRRGMFGHGRVLPPECRSIEGARGICRVLLTKAARRLRREGYYCSGVWLWLDHGEGGWSGKRILPTVHDDQALLSEFQVLWEQAASQLSRRTKIYRIGVTLFDLSPSNSRQLDFLLADDSERQRWEAINSAIDLLNYKWGKTVASVGFWPRQHLENIGGKISYTRIPSAEDFW